MDAAEFYKKHDGIMKKKCSEKNYREWQRAMFIAMQYDYSEAMLTELTNQFTAEHRVKVSTREIYEVPKPTPEE